MSFSKSSRILAMFVSAPVFLAACAAETTPSEGEPQALKVVSSTVTPARAFIGLDEAELGTFACAETGKRYAKTEGPLCAQECNAPCETIFSSSDSGK